MSSVHAGTRCDRPYFAAPSMANSSFGDSCAKRSSVPRSPKSGEQHARLRAHQTLVPIDLDLAHRRQIDHEAALTS